MTYTSNMPYEYSKTIDDISLLFGALFVAIYIIISFEIRHVRAFQQLPRHSPSRHPHHRRNNF